MFQNDERCGDGWKVGRWPFFTGIKNLVGFVVKGIKSYPFIYIIMSYTIVKILIKQPGFHGMPLRACGVLPMRAFQRCIRIWSSHVNYVEVFEVAIQC